MTNARVTTLKNEGKTVAANAAGTVLAAANTGFAASRGTLEGAAAGASVAGKNIGKQALLTTGEVGAAGFKNIGMIGVAGLGAGAKTSAATFEELGAAATSQESRKGMKNMFSGAFGALTTAARAGLKVGELGGKIVLKGANMATKAIKVGGVRSTRRQRSSRRRRTTRRSRSSRPRR